MTQQQTFYTPEQAIEAEKIARRRKIAEALLAQSMQPLGGTEVVSGRAVPMSPLAPIAKLVQAYAGNRQQQEADTAQKALAEQSRAAVAAALADYQGATTPRPGTSGGVDESGFDTHLPTPAYNPTAADRRNATIALASKMGALPQIASAQLARALAGPTDSFAKVDPKDYTPESVRDFNASGDYSALRPRSKVEVAGGTAYDPYQTPPGSTVGQTEIERELRAAGYTPGSTLWNQAMQDRVRKQTSSAPVADVSVKVENTLGQGLAGNVKDIVAQTHGAAQGAVGTVDTINRMRQAIASGNVTVGPGATVRQNANQIAYTLGLAGDNTADKLRNTQQVGRGLAQFALESRKSLKGQGQISDYEGKLLQRAAAGEIGDFTIPELQSFLGTTDRVARASYNEHQRILGVMKSDPNVAPLIPYYQVPDLPQSRAGGMPPGVTPSDIDAELRRRGVSP